MKLKKKVKNEKQQKKFKLKTETYTIYFQWILPSS